MFFSLTVTFHLSNFFRIRTEYAAVDRLSCVSHWLLTYPLPSGQRKQKRFS